MEYETRNQIISGILDKYRKILYYKENGEPYYWFDKDRLDRKTAFKILKDIQRGFRGHNPEFFYSIDENYYQYDCIFIDVAIDDPGVICNLWGYGIDKRSEAIRPYFVWESSYNSWPKDKLLEMKYRRIPLEDLKLRVKRLEAENLSRSSFTPQGRKYEKLVDSLGYDEGIIMDLEDFGLLDDE